MSISSKLYLDVCALCRQFDDQSQSRIRIETQSIELILSHVRQEEIILIASPAHDLEIDAIEDEEEKQTLVEMLNRLGFRANFNLQSTRQRAEELVEKNLGVADAAHLAFAEQSEADFITVDDRLIKRSKKANLSIWVGSPLQYCEKENLK